MARLGVFFFSFQKNTTPISLRAACGLCSAFDTNTLVPSTRECWSLDLEGVHVVTIISTTLSRKVHRYIESLFSSSYKLIPPQSLSRALKALVQFAVGGLVDETNLSAKLVRDMVKGLESQATAEMEAERQNLLASMRDLIICMRSVMNDQDAEQQRALLRSAQELKLHATTLYYAISPNEAPHASHAAEASPRDAFIEPIAQKTASTLVVPTIRIEPSPSQSEHLIDEANELIRELSNKTSPRIALVKAAQDRDWVVIPPVTLTDSTPIEVLLDKIPEGAPRMSTVPSLKFFFFLPFLASSPLP